MENGLYGRTHGPPAQNHSGNGHVEQAANDAILPRVAFTQATFNAIDVKAA